MRIATVNVRGWHWALQAKTGETSWLMSKDKLDILLLSDVHTSDAEDSTVTLEEFVMTVGMMSAIVLAPTTQKGWRDNDNDNDTLSKVRPRIVRGLS